MQDHCICNGQAILSVHELVVKIESFLCAFMLFFYLANAYAYLYYSLYLNQNHFYLNQNQILNIYQNVYLNAYWNVDLNVNLNAFLNDYLNAYLNAFLNENHAISLLVFALPIIFLPFIILSSNHAYLLPTKNWIL